MELVLEIVNGGGDARDSQRRMVFGHAGGRIGRAADCDWVLPSPYVSRHHATVSQSDGVFYIESAGENGIALNDPSQMLARSERHVLRAGDRLFIDEFEISVGVSAAAEPLRSTLGVEVAGPLDSPADDLDPLQRLLAVNPSPSRAEHAPVAWNSSSSLADHFTPPQPQQPSLAVPEDWDNTTFDRVKREPVPAPPPLDSVASSTPPPRRDAPMGRDQHAWRDTPAATGAQRAPREDFDAATMCRSLGVDPENFAPHERAELAGLMRTMLQALIDERQARVQVAGQLRLRSVPTGLSEHNPLRLAVNAQDAARLLFTSFDSGRMSPTQAIADALDDVRAHHLAMGAALRSAFESIVSRFDPQTLQTRFDRHLKHVGVLPIGAKFRYWQLYAELFEELTGAHDGGFQQLFGDVFAGAYESQFNALKGARRAPA
jgi:type VI secretion system FHA domain protein